MKSKNKLIAIYMVGGFFFLVGVATFLLVLIGFFTGENYACR